MANLPGNPHADDAIDALTGAIDPTLTQAILAVAFELRTANLLAAISIGASPAAFGAQLDTLRADVLARLGYDAAWNGGRR